MRATPHDELMRKAGFETEYYVELARRREERRLELLRATRVAAFVGAVAGTVAWITGMDGKSSHFPRALVIAMFALAMVGWVAVLLEARMTRDRESRLHRSVLWLWKRHMRRRRMEDQF